MAKPEWWRSGLDGSVSTLNSSAVEQCADIIAAAIYKAHRDEMGGGRV